MNMNRYLLAVALSIDLWLERRARRRIVPGSEAWRASLAHSEHLREELRIVLWGTT